jgi:hypothetical protein
MKWTGLPKKLKKAGGWQIKNALLNENRGRYQYYF